MILISVQNVQKGFGAHEVLRDVTFSLQKGEKMGLIGVNGCGKTTLMRMLSGEEQPDGGAIHKNRELRIGYLAQIDDIALTDTVWGAMLRVFEPVIALEKRLHALEAELAAHTDDEAMTLHLSAEYQRLTEQFARMEGYAYEGEMIGVLTGLGIGRDMFDRNVGTLSGGERTRLSLSKLLLQKPDVLLMDEPTNHLDLEAIEWLQNYLSEYKGTLLLISHDRYFLDHVCTTMGEMLGGRVIKFTGNYTEYMKKRSADFEARMKAYQLQQKEIEREQAIIERYRSFNREKSIRAAESRQKRLDKVERLDKPLEENHVRFAFDVRRRMGEEALEVKNLQKSFDGRTVFHDINFKLRTGDRVALIGPNGVGKSTLFKILMNRETPDRGAVRFGVNVDIGYYDQHQQELNPENTVLDEVWNAFPTMEQSKVRGALGLFLFSGDDVFAKINSLSGGERGRVALTKLMLRKDNLLLLDEPTNHLDMDSREVLEDALYDFPGTILAISHDRYFINRFADRVMVMNEDGVTEYLGNFDDYMEKRDRPVPPAETAAEGATKTSILKERKRDRQQSARLRELKSAVAKAEEAIAANEQRIGELEARLADPATYADQARMLELTEQYRMEQQNQETLYDALEQAETAYDEAAEEA
ncbi:MAG TPA: ABC-F family ATP-binding cassette domain-containing protein [Candidatus Limiplasma sp.]|nr:ABC-F family ATP-binding cassette domain-containing protein [Candidatus Limiplasma sp.]HPS82199.1 ABC-F family ATP-binding cassette domain-containing protein [Candidatus Limiplasma sp.]